MVLEKQAKVIIEDIEERLWHENVLGSDTPEKLLDTLVYLLGLSFALRSRLGENTDYCDHMFEVV